ncbi:hypothetical protein F383_24089 [Gossypium arboreum]|uniref:Uncharacterized protein n=1 Tax=Gossypium arboreum TaxID=29729 RepID=A0A0B0NXA3_GOSAR|nr:hypothetical protein F383_24089 [Gossypium arboreum]
MCDTWVVLQFKVNLEHSQGTQECG